MKLIIEPSKEIEAQAGSQNELDRQAFGGTERMGALLEEVIDPILLSKFQIIRSRVRGIEPGKIAILYNHDLPEDPEAQHLKNPFQRKRFAKQVFVSHWQQEQFHDKLGVPYSAGIVIPNAIKLFSPKDLAVKSRDTAARLNVIYTPTPHRGLEILLPVFDKLSKKYPHIHLDVFSSFKLYGWQERDKMYDSLFSFCENHPNITYHGTQPNKVVREYSARAHIFAYPSIWRETSCLCAIEAMSAKCFTVMPAYGALTETSMSGMTCPLYQWTEDKEEHARRFERSMSLVIDNAGTFLHPEMMFEQKCVIDGRHSIYAFKRNWEDLLKSIL